MDCPFLDVDVDVTGWPCTDFSRAGEQRREEGDTMVVFLSWAKWHRERKTPLVVGENVEAS